MPAAKKVAPQKTVKPAVKTTARPGTATRKKVTPVAAPAAPVAKTAPVKAVKTEKTEKPVKVKKPKLVRDSFTMPKDEYQVIDALKSRASALGRPAKKSEMLRAGIKALAAMTDAQFKSILSDVPAIKTGRPKNAK